MAKPLRSAWLILAVAALPAGADDLSSRLEQLEREAARRAAEAPAAPAAPAEPPPAKPSPQSARLTAIQNRRARAYREQAASAARRAAAAENAGASDPAAIARIAADRREGERFSRKADDVFRPGTEEYQAAYEQWIASEAPAAPVVEPAPGPPAASEEN